MESTEIRLTSRTGQNAELGILSSCYRNPYLVAVLSKASIRSRWAQAELNAALMEELSGKGVAVLPVLIRFGTDSAMTPTNNTEQGLCSMNPDVSLSSTVGCPANGARGEPTRRTVGCLMSSPRRLSRIRRSASKISYLTGHTVLLIPFDLEY
jgi:hypothetical protein